MRISYLQGKVPRHSLQDSTEHDHRDLKQAIKNFLCAASRKKASTDVCPRCGRQMEYVDSVFSLYGADDAWNVRLPVCRCTTETPVPKESRTISKMRLSR